MPLEKRRRHFTREPWRLVPLAGLLAGGLPLIKWTEPARAQTGFGMLAEMGMMAALGMLAAALLLARSSIKSVFRSNLVLWLGILVIALGVCAVSVFVTAG
jgi:hypothetical protein